MLCLLLLDERTFPVVASSTEMATITLAQGGSLSSHPQPLFLLFTPR